MLNMAKRLLRSTKYIKVTEKESDQRPVIGAVTFRIYYAKHVELILMAVRNEN